MQPFNLEEYKKNPSLKVATRDGRPVRIICTNRKARSGNIVGLIGEDESLIYVWNNDGKHIVSEIPDNDLFFAGKEEELTEFEKAVNELITHYMFTDTVNGDDAKNEAVKLLTLARKELQPEFDKEMDKMLAETDKVVYQKGKQDVLKSLPKWKKSDRHIECGVDDFFFTLEDDGTMSPYYSTEIEEGQYYLSEQDLLNLPKEE